MNADRQPHLDEALQLWAKNDAGDQAAIERIIQHARHTSAPSRKWMVWTAGALAACVAVGLAIIPALTPPTPETDPLGAAVQLAVLSEEEQASFDLLYTPTQDEEYLI